MSDNERDRKIPGDNPIQDPKDDVLGRNDVAESFVNHVLELDVSEGAVVGVFGPWGSGKTSFINLAKAKFKANGNPVFDFNPWMFSGTEQLVQRFFTELSSEFNISKLGKITKFLIKVRLRVVVVVLDIICKIIKSLTKFLIKFSPSILAIYNPGISLLMKVLGESLQDGKKGIKEQREKLSKALEREFEEQRGIVVLDDVDRLTTDEIRTIFKLVRLTANFPNLVYIVACDRFRVEEALEEKGLPESGRAYLEKIFQLPYNLPEAPDQILQEQIEESVRAIHQDEKSTYSTPFDQVHWHSVFLGIVKPLIRNMRDVRRYDAAVRGTLINLRGQVELADVLGLEAIRIFLPDVFRRLHSVIDIITVASFLGEEARDIKDTNKELVFSESENEDKKKVEKLREVAKTPERKDIVNQMLQYLFKYFSQTSQTSLLREELLKRCRVAHEDILRLYLECVPGANLSALEKAKEILASMNDQNALDRRIHSFEPEEWPYIIRHLLGFRDQFRHDYVEPGIIVLFNLFPDWPKNSLLLRGIARMNIGEIARALLKHLKTPDEVEKTVRRVFPELTSLYSKRELIHLVGHQQEGDGFISKEAEAEFSEALFNHAQSMSIDDLAQEEALAWTLKFIKNSGHPVAIADSPKITFAILRSSLKTITITRSHRERFQGLFWDALVELYGAEDILIARVDSLNQQLKDKDFKQWLEDQNISTPEAEAIIKLAEEYREGRRL